MAVVFLVHASVVASWGPRVPAIKERLGIDDGHLAVALAALAGGMFIGTRLAAWLRDHLGGRRLVRGGAMVLALSLLGPAFASTFVALVVVLAVMGVAMGVLDVAMNAEAVDIERERGQPIMAGLHGCWSTGMLAAGGAAALVAALGISAGAHLAGAAVVLLVLVVVGTASLPPDAALGVAAPASSEAGPDATLRREVLRAVLVLGLVAACSFALEGAMADWSAVYLHDHLEASPGVAALGFVGFALGMTASRFVADRVVTRFGAPTVVRLAGIGAAAGVVLIVAAPAVAPAILGFVLVGAAIAPVVPVVFRAAGQGIGGHHRLAWVVTIGYLGTVVGPVVIGGVTTAAGLRAGLAVPVLVGVAVALAAPATAADASDESDASEDRTHDETEERRPG